MADGWCGIRYTPDSVKPYVQQLEAMTKRAGRDFSRFEITVGLDPGLRPTLDTVQRFAEAGVHRLFVFAPGWTPRRKFQTDLYPQMEAFANDVMAKL